MIQKRTNLGPLITLVAATKGILAPNTNRIFSQIQQASIASSPVNKKRIGLNLTKGELHKTTKDTRPVLARVKKPIAITVVHGGDIALKYPFRNYRYR